MYRSYSVWHIFSCQKLVKLLLHLNMSCASTTYFVNLDQRNLIGPSNTCSHHADILGPKIFSLQTKVNKMENELKAAISVLMTGQNKENDDKSPQFFFWIFVQSIEDTFLLFILQMSWVTFNPYILCLSCLLLFQSGSVLWILAMSGFFISDLKQKLAHNLTHFFFRL